MFTDKIEPIIFNGVATIGGKYIIPKRVVKVSWSCTDDEGKLHINRFNNVLYFPESSSNIISKTALDESMKSDDVK